MLKTSPGSPDGCNVREYEEDVVYDVPDGLAEVFVTYDLAEQTDEPVTEPIEEPAETAGEEVAEVETDTTGEPEKKRKWLP